MGREADALLTVSIRRYREAAGRRRNRVPSCFCASVLTRAYSAARSCPRRCIRRQLLDELVTGGCDLPPQLRDLALDRALFLLMV